MPQLDFSIFPSQFFWLCISFFCMLFIMSKFIIPKTAEMINLRKNKIDADLEEAAKLKQKVEISLQKYNEALRKATEEANLSILKAKEELNQTIERRQTELNNELNRQIADSEKKIASTKKKSYDQIDGMVTEIVPEIIKKLGFSKISAKDIKSVLESNGDQ